MSQRFKKLGAVGFHALKDIVKEFKEWNQMEEQGVEEKREQETRNKAKIHPLRFGLI